MKIAYTKIIVESEGVEQVISNSDGSVKILGNEFHLELEKEVMARAIRALAAGEEDMTIRDMLGRLTRDPDKFQEFKFLVKGSLSHPATVRAKGIDAEDAITNAKSGKFSVYDSDKTKQRFRVGINPDIKQENF